MKARQKGKQAFMKEPNLELELEAAHKRLEKFANAHEGEWLDWLHGDLDQAQPIPEDLFERMGEIHRKAEANRNKE